MMKAMVTNMKEEESVRDFVVEKGKKRSFVDPNYGKINLSDVVMDTNYISLIFQIDNVSEKLQKQIDTGIRNLAIETYHDKEDMWLERGITLEKLEMRETWKILTLEFNDGELESKILVGAVDTNGRMEITLEILANVEAFRDEIKAIVMKAIEKRYFG